MVEMRLRGLGWCLGEGWVEMWVRSLGGCLGGCLGRPRRGGPRASAQPYLKNPMSYALPRASQNASRNASRNVQAVTSWYQLVLACTSGYQLVPAGTSWYQLGTSWVPYLDGARAKKITGQKNSIFPWRFRRWPGAGAQKRAGPATFNGFGQGRPQLLLKASLYMVNGKIQSA